MSSTDAATAPPAPAAGGASRTVLFLTVLVDLLGFGIVIPFLPLFAQQMGVGAAGVGLVLAAYSLTQLLFAPMLGKLSDRVGRRPIIMVGLFGSAAGYLIYGFAATFIELLLSRVVHGACAATVATAQAYVADTTGESERARGMGMIGAAFGLGFVLGPALGGLLGHRGLRVPVFFASGLSLLNLLLAALLLPESHRPARRSALELRRILEPLASLPRTLANRAFSSLFSLAFLFTFAFAALEATFALLAAQLYGYGAMGVGGLLAFAGLLQALTQGYLLGKIVGRTGEARLVRAGALAMALGLAPLASVSSHVLLFMLLGLVAIGYGLSSPSVASLLSRGAGSHGQGEVLGANQSALSMARIVGPIFGGLTYQFLAPAAPYFGAAALMVLALLLTRGLDRRPL